MPLKDKFICGLLITLSLLCIILIVLVDGETIKIPPLVITNPIETMVKDVSNQYEPPLIQSETEPITSEETTEEITTTEPKINQPIFEYDIYDIVCLAKLIQGEGGGLSKLEKSAIVWCALNYLDSGQWEHTIIEVVKSPNRFTGYSENCKVTNENLWISQDVLERYARELMGEDDVGRTLPKEYICFRGFKWYDKAAELGLYKPTYSHNWYFTVEDYRKDKWERNYWNWSLTNPYE